MGVSLLGSLGSKLGMDLVGSILDKTLPNAADLLKSGLRNPLDQFESVVGMFGGKSSRKAPAKQFTLALPWSIQKQYGSGEWNMSRLSGRLNALQSALGTLSEIAGLLSRFQGQGKPESSTSTFSGVSTGRGMHADTHALAQSAGFTASTSTGAEMGPMEMFQRMQEAQKAAQMFELAVKLADIQHQAAMSAIRGIRY